MLYLPKIQTAEEAALWNDILTALESALDLPVATIKVYVLVEQVEASFQLMEIRAALGMRFVGFNTGRWDYINSVADAMAWNSEFQNPNIDAISMTFGYMRHYEDRVRRAVNTPDLTGRFALWQGGMEPNIPVGSPAGVEAGMKKALAGAEREQREGASGKWVAHWKMVHMVRPVWGMLARRTSLGGSSPNSPMRRKMPTVSFSSNRLLAPCAAHGTYSVLRFSTGNAFLRGLQAAALKPADFFGNEDVLYLMEDMATGEIRVSILWEWLHKGAPFTEDAPEAGVRAGHKLTKELFTSLVDEEYAKLLAASDRDVHDDSKQTTLPIARVITEAMVAEPAKSPWYIDLLNLNIGNHDPAEASRRIATYMSALRKDGTRITKNLDFDMGSTEA